MNINVVINRLFAISLLWLLLEGIFRKWLLPSLTVQLFAIKYVLFTLIYIIFFVHYPFIPKTKKPFQFFILLFTVYCGFQLFNNPFNAPALVTAFGYINYLFFIPLLLIVPYYFSSIEKIERFIKILAWVSLPIFILGAVQYFLPDDHVLNHFANDDQKINRVSTFTRSMSVFTFVKIYTVYLLITITIFYAYIFYLLKKGRNILFYVFLIIFGILNIFMTGSRLPVVLSLVYLIIISFYIFFKISNLRKTILISFITGNILLLLLYNYNSLFNSAITAFLNRVEFTESVAAKGVEGYGAKDRAIDRVDAFKYADEAGWLGFGIGTTYQGTGFFLTTKRPELKFEEEGERVVLELGIIGGVLIILIRLAIAAFSFFWLYKTKDSSFFLLLLPLVLILSPPILFINETTFNYFDNFSYWFSFGLILSLKKLYHKTS